MRNCPICGTRYPDDIAYCPADGTATAAVVESAAPPDPLVGKTIDRRYRIEARIGEGGMGVVYRATHVVLKKALAIKVMRGEQAHDSEVVQRFVQEARSSSAIGHPNIVNISDFGTTPDGSVFFAMEFLQGQTLGLAMLTGRLLRERAFRIFIQIASALEAAHEAGIVHRDLKPDNIFLTREPDHEDFVKILDFGIAKVKNAAAKITRTGMVFGTPHYMSPEQAAGQSVDHRSDIYSLGVIMYQVFAGQLPFDAESYMGVMTKHMFEQPPLPSRWTGELRGPIEDIILKALQKKPEQRYQTMLQLREDLERAQSGQGLSMRAAVNSEPAFAGFTGTQPVLEAPRPRQSQDNAWVASSSTDDAWAAPSAQDDDPVSVPVSRRPLWALVVIGVLLAIGVVSFGVWGGKPEPVPAASEAAAEQHVVAPATPVAAPEPEQSQPAAAPEPKREPPAHVVERREPHPQPNAVVKPHPSAAPKPARPPRATTKGDRSEVVDPWQ